VPLLEIVRRMQQTYESRRLAAALLLFVGERVPMLPMLSMLTQRKMEMFLPLHAGWQYSW
jgi:hypothetical protein